VESFDWTLCGMSRAYEGISTFAKRYELALGVALVLVVGVVATFLTLQGWRSRIPAFDMIPHIRNARALVATGAIPQHGDTGSYGSFKPPGTAWLIVPSTLLFPDVRLSEYVGSAWLHFAALLGLFLLARNYFGTWCACFSVVLYGLSANGIFLAGSLWPNGRPDFFVWTVLLASMWVTRRKAIYLAAAIAVWAIGIYVDMGIAPALFILPALGLYYRPPVRLKPLLIGAALVLGVWSPYLRLEATRGFADIRSQLLLQNIFTADYRQTWCNPTLTLQRWEDAASVPVIDAAGTQISPDQAPYVIRTFLALANDISGKILFNFETAASVPGVSTALLLVLLSSLVLLSVPGSSSETVELSQCPRFWRDRPTLLAVSMILFDLLLYGLVILYHPGSGGGPAASMLFSVRRLLKILVLGGIAILVGRWIAVITNELLVRVRVHIQPVAHAERRKLPVLSLLIPWFILLLVAEPDKPERFWWVWPLQVMFLAAFVTHVLPRLRTPRLVIWISSILLIFALVGNSFLFSRANAWTRNGWAGSDAEQIQVVDYIANQIRADGKEQAPIGYQTFIYPFMAEYNITNPQYKVGAEFDLLFDYRRGISNTNQCAEGISSKDEYRIVQTKPQEDEWAPRQYFNVHLDDSFKMLRQVGSYQVHKRDPSYVKAGAW
jgi:hypothetical protein